MSDLTPEQRNRAAVHKAMEIIVENEITGVSEWRYNLTDRLTEAALSALRAATPGDGLDARDVAAVIRHYDNRDFGRDDDALARVMEWVAATEQGRPEWAHAIAAEYVRLAATEQGERTHE